MGELKDCLRSILREAAVAAGLNEDGFVTLSERRESGRLPMQVVEITGVPSTATVVSLAKGSQHAILREAEGQSWLKICDYMLMEEVADGCRVTMVELKTSLQKRSDGLEQLRRSLPLAKYLLSVCEVERQRSWPGQFNYALIAEKRTNRLNKQRIRRHADAETEAYEDIRVAVRVGTRFDFASLAA